MGSPEIKLRIRSHADRPCPLLLLDGYGQHFSFPTCVRVVQARLSMRNR